LDTNAYTPLTHHPTFGRIALAGIDRCDEEAMMTRTAACRDVEQMLREQMPILNRKQRRALARWVTGTTLADSSNKPSVVQALALLGEAATSSLEDAWEQWLNQPAHQTTDPPESGTLDVPSPLACGAALLQWVMRLWTGGPLVLGIDASLRRDAVVLLRISVLYRGTAIPVSWVIVPANQKGAWMPHLQRMLRRPRSRTSSLGRYRSVDYYTHTDTGAASRASYHSPQTGPGPVAYPPPDHTTLLSSTPGH
jgi:hypothetical protein